MTIRRTAHWQQSIDDRILEHLRDESWSTPRFMTNVQGIHATETQVRERCRVLADADLVAFLTSDQDMVELTGRGKQYLEGKVDVELYPRPRHPRDLER
jgi:hypothetical protein